MRTGIILCLAYFFCAPSIGQDDQKWGDIRGTVVFHGEVPKPEVINIYKKASVAGTDKRQIPKIIVDQKTKGVADVIVWIDSPDKSKIPIHPKLQAVPKTASLVAENLRFQPDILLLRKGQPVLLQNQDPVAVNFKLGFFDLNKILRSGEEKQVVAQRETRGIESDFCGIYPWMNVRCIVKDHPYLTKTDSDGDFAIRNAPLGIWRLRLWHASVGWLNVEVNGAGVSKSIRKREIELKDSQGTQNTFVMAKDSFEPKHVFRIIGKGKDR